MEKGDPMVTLANRALVSARQSAAFDHAIKDRRRSSRFGRISRTHAKQLLRVLMSHISEERYAASWHIDLEFRLWEEMQSRSRKGLMAFERAGLILLSGAANGWWTLDRFVSMKRWLGLYETYSATQPRKFSARSR